MAGDWIPIACDIHAKPETVRIAAALRRSTDEVVGMLVRFWSWAQSQSSDGTLEGLDIAMAAAACHVSTKFLESLASVGWLVQADHGLVVPNFDRWMGNSAKSRLQGALRKQRERSRMRRSALGDDVTHTSRNCHANVTQLSRAQRDTSVTIEENRREENKNNSSPPIKGPPLLLHDNRDPPLLSPDGDSSPNGDDARVDPDRDAFEKWWRHYPRKVGKQAAFRAYVNARKRICKERKCAPSEARSLLLQACIAFSQSPKARSEFCPHPGTWLNQGRYDDDPAEWDRVSNEQAAESLEEVLRKAMSDG